MHIRIKEPCPGRLGRKCNFDEPIKFVWARTYAALGITFDLWKGVCPECGKNATFTKARRHSGPQ